MTVIQFVVEIETMYGAFTTEGMKKAVMNRLRDFSEKQIDKLFETYIRTIHGTCKPDLKNVLDCMEKAGIRPEDKPKNCICCGNTWTSTQVECPRCSYSRECGNPETYRSEIQNRKAAMARLFADLMTNKLMRKPGGYDE